MRRGVSVLALLLLAAVGVGAHAGGEQASWWIVAFDHSVGPEDIARLTAAGAVVLRAPPRTDFAAVELVSSPAAVAKLQALPGVRLLEPDAVVTPLEAPNDLYWADQWGPVAIHAPEAWAIERGSRDVVMAVIDTGVDYGHPDLADNVWRNAGEVLDGVDNDGNGYVDDLVGWDCGNSDNDPQDFIRSHGTHVAGTVAAVTNNNLTVAGVAQVRILIAKTFTDDERVRATTASMLAECIRYAADNGADVLGMSLSAAYPVQIVTEAIEYAALHGRVITVAAGNAYGGAVAYPATLPQAIAVSALSPDFTIADFSSVGQKVELAAPGEHVLSLESRFGTYGYGQHLVMKDPLDTRPTARFRDGTSMAQPHVAAVACLILSKNPDLTAEEVRALLVATADDLGEPGRDSLYGFGIVNAFAAVSAA